MATAFETEMGVLPEISQAVKEMDWILPTDIQSESVPLILGGGDVLMAAETGSGKTGAFCIPVIQIVYETLKEVEKKLHNPTKQAPKLLDHIQLSFHDRSPAFAVSQDGLLCQNRENAWNGARATVGIRNKGKYYYEATVNDEGLCRVGWSTETASYDIGTDSNSYGYGGTGKKSHNRQFDDYGEEFKLHDTVGCLLDLDSNNISYTLNGRDLGNAFRLPPQLSNIGLVPSVVLKNAEIKFNFGAEPFKFQPPKGFVPILSADPSNKFVPVKSIQAKGDVRLKERAPIAVIIEPTRELAEQTFDQINRFSVHLKNPTIQADLLIGGDSTHGKNLKYAHIVVATPGRLDSCISAKELFLSNCRFFILDECDALLSSGYTDLIQQLHSKMPIITPDAKRLQMIVCSATLHSPDVKKLAVLYKKMMHFPMWVDLKGQDSVPDTVHHVVCVIDPNQDTLWQKLFGQSQAICTDGVHAKDRLMLNKFTPEMMSEAVKLLKGEYVIRAIEKQMMDKAIIFCRTKLDCDNLEQKFVSLGGGPNAAKNSKFSCVCLHSDRSTQERKANFDRFKRGEVRFLICTDVAARGIDVTGLPYGNLALQKLLYTKNEND
ncbi:ATP-dependent RNA helicase ddx1 [Cichlidogyrus casuarinus]|uniref:ATP-dependent RNA helicase n=1 Tax=Cichlidogyrus casuarinus TaxID=1844966 RepID=A0ABD2QG56_9PLAT